MNLHRIAGNAISAVNPWVLGDVIRSDGYTTDSAGVRTPKNKPILTNLLMQVQALQFKDLTQLDGLNISGVQRKVYIKGRVDGVIRAEQKGGDLIVVRQGWAQGTWLCVVVMEYWPGWVSIGITKQMETPI